MKRAPNADAPNMFARWVRATSWGWLLGLVLMLGLVGVWDLVGGNAQFMIGVGMGLGVGFAQARALGDSIQTSRSWILATVGGIAAPFLLNDLGSAVGAALPYSLPVYVVVGGLLAGWLQGRVLQRRCSSARGWVAASTLGWGVPAGAIALSDALPTPGTGSLVFLLVAFLFGGVLLGMITGRHLETLCSSKDQMRGRTEVGL